MYCEQCGIVAVPLADLPVVLPHDAEFRPTGESPLRYHQGFLQATCPRCHGPARRETDTMDMFIDSSWYQYRYLNPRYEHGPFDPQKGQYWLPVDQYTGGIEHATRHLLYTRFWTKVMRDLGLVEFDEPMPQFFANGIITAPGGERLSTSRGTLVVADDLVKQHGVDVLRGHLMFFTPWDHGGPWNERGLVGIARFLQRVWMMVLEPPRAISHGTGDPYRLRRRTHQAIRRVTEDLDHFKFNTAIAALMTLANDLRGAGSSGLSGTEAWTEAVRCLLLLMAPFFPHIAEELWMRIGGPYSVHQQAWPRYDSELAAEDAVTLVLQVNGRVRDRVQVPAGITDAEARETALKSRRIQQYLEGKTVAQVVVVPSHLVNIVVR